MKLGRWAVAAAMLVLSALQVNAATTLLPNGMQCFQNADGPLAGGSVYMYYPATTTMKQTWQDSSQTTLNSQPIALDSNGCAIIYGVGSYRQQVYTGSDNTSTLVYDQLTTDTSAFNSTFWAGLSGGTANAITVTYSGFNFTDGTVINFVALNTNTGATTLNVSSTGATPVVKDTTSGPTALTGTEIVAGNMVSVVYYATDGSFHLLNGVIASASGSTAPLCGASGFSMTNNSSVPTTSLDISWSGVTLVNSAGLPLTSTTSTTVTLNTTVSGAVNSWDTGTRPTSDTGYVWLISNGSTFGSLGSASSTAPTMPSGYTYKCLVSAVQFSGASAVYLIMQKGNRVQYRPVGGNTTTLPQAGTGTSGTAGSNCSTTTPTYSSQTVTGATRFIPAIATRAQFYAASNRGAAGIGYTLVAPNTSYGGILSTNEPPLYINNSAADSRLIEFTLEAATIGYCGSGAGSYVGVLSYILPVNAN